MRTRSIQLVCATSALALSIALPATASAQQAAPQPEGTARPSQDMSGEIVVTANKREERLHDVAASITAITGDLLENRQIVNAQDFQQFVPTLNFQAADEARLFNFSVRGIGTESFSVGVEPSVATIVDGVVYTRPGSVFDGLGDIERVEVLNGPQGTLQGKNASAGAVSIVTKRPGRSFEGRAEVTLAEDNEYRGELMLTGPISNTLFFRAFGYYRHNDGEVINVATGDTVNNIESYGFRGKLEWEPLAGVNFLLSGDIGRRNADCCAEPIRVPAASGNVTAAFTGTPVGPDNHYVNLNTLQEGWQENRGLSLEANVDLGSDLTLTSLTAYREYRDFAIRDRDGTNAPFTGVTPQQLFEATVPGISAADALARLDALLVNPLDFSMRGGLVGESNSLEKNDTFSQELRLTSPAGGTFDYLVGLFYYNSLVERQATIAGVRSNIAGNVSFPTPTTVTVNRATAYVLADMYTRVRTQNQAIFGNVNFRPVDGLTLTAGFRYLHEDLDWTHRKVTGPNGDHIGAADPARPGANFGTPNFDFTRSFSDSELIGKLVAKYAFTPDIQIYGSWARGYKGEAVDADIFLTQAGYDTSPVAPEKSRAWEFGFKGRLFDRLLEVNVDYYDTLFTGYQTTSSGADGSGAPVLRSAGKLFTHGFEGDISLHPLQGLTLSGNFLFAHNEFGDLFVTPTQNVKGGVPLNAPDTKYGFVGDYRFDVGEWGITLSGNYTWTSETLFTNLADANNPNSVWLRPAYGVANASVGIRTPGDRFRLSLFVKNLFDEHYVAGMRRISGSVGGAGAVAQALPRDFNRYFGATFSARF